MRFSEFSDFWSWLNGRFLPSTRFFCFTSFYTTLEGLVFRPSFIEVTFILFWLSAWISLNSLRAAFYCALFSLLLATFCSRSPAPSLTSRPLPLPFSLSERWLARRRNFYYLPPTAFLFLQIVFFLEISPICLLKSAVKTCSLIWRCVKRVYLSLLLDLSLVKFRNLEDLVWRM